MITFVLPGYSKENRPWLETIAEGIKVDGQIRSISWDHWGEPKKEFDPKLKARLLSSIAKGKKVKVVAKSIASLVTAYMILNNPSQFEKVILCGIPLNDLDDISGETIKSALKLLDPKDVVVYQNDQDPHGTYDEIRSFIDKINPEIKVIKKELNTHDYFYLEDFNKDLS